MKRIYNVNLGILLIIALVLAACGGTETAPAAQDTQSTPLSAADLGLDTSELSVQAPGDQITVVGVVGRIASIGTNRMGTNGEVTYFIRHKDSLAQFEGLTSTNTADPVFRQDASWRVVDGLAGDDSCLSFESINFPGQFLRHADFRVVLAPNDGSALFAADASWCTRSSLDGKFDAGDLGKISFESFNFPDHYLRDFNGEMWLARSGGPNPWDNPAGFTENTSLGFYLPLAE